MPSHRSRAGACRCALLLLGALALLAGRGASVRAAGRPPNIILILADDLGWTDLGCTGSRYYETPNIDRLARAGVRFTSFYVCQNCAPTRAALMSGQYAPRTGIYTVGTLARGREADRAMIVPENRRRLPLDRSTIAAELRKAGYATALFGKWHLGNRGPYHPSRRGFDEAVVSAGRHFGFRTTPAVEVPEGAYLADFLTDLSLRFIDSHRDRPFFLYLPHFGVHSPYQAKPDLVARFEKKAPAGGHRSPVYAAMIASVDESVGRIAARIDELGLARDTLIIFASDNGGVGGYGRTEPPAKRRGITDNAPLRGGKGTLYEGGIRVPFIARWPGVIPPGSTCAKAAVHVDLFPTFLALAGAAPPRGQPLDGVSIVRLLRDPSADLEREAIYWHFPGYLESYVHRRGWRTTPVGVIRRGRYKLLEFFEDGRTELYDLEADLGEHVDLAPERPATVANLRRRLAAWRRRLGAAMPERRSRGGAR